MMRNAKRVLVAILIPAATVAVMSSTAVAASSSAIHMGQSQAATSADMHPGQAMKLVPHGIPKGCPPFYFCSYIGTGDGQGSSNICFERNGAFSLNDWGSLTGPNGDNCHKNSEALVNVHTAGDVELHSATNGRGEETCIGAQSYYLNTSGNFYPDGEELFNNINSSYDFADGSC